MTDEESASLEGDPTRGRTSHLIVEKSEHRFSGPLPPPDLLRQYDAIVPDAANRIIAMAEGQAAHRRQLEDRATDAIIEDTRAERLERKRGQFYGFTIGITGITAGALIVIFANNSVGIIAGTALSGGTIVTLVSIFVIGLREKGGKEDSAD